MAAGWLASSLFQWEANYLHLIGAWIWRPSGDGEQSSRSAEGRNKLADLVGRRTGSGRKSVAVGDGMNGGDAGRAGSHFLRIMTFLKRKR
jgi:hypothetical protein